jgi:outer membrane protein OmpA-like peptidoglycan-associated protein
VPETKGCPKRIRLEAGRIVILDRVEFATGKDVILERSAPLLDEVRATLAANAQLKRIRVEGHTDDRGKDSSNLSLSGRRAASVKRWLVEHGVAAERFEAYGCGENRPIADNKSRDGRQQNRRVEFHIVDPAPKDGAPSTEGCEAAP